MSQFSAYHSWSEVSSNGQPVPDPRCWHSLVANDDGSRVYVFGGYDLKNDLNDLWRYSVGTSLLSPPKNEGSLKEKVSNDHLKHVLIDCTAQNKWTLLNPTTKYPLPRDRHSMVSWLIGLLFWGVFFCWKLRTDLLNARVGHVVVTGWNWICD
jgi:hypothetical protein